MKTLFLWVATCWAAGATAQSTSNANVAGATHTLTVFDPYMNRYSNIEGTPYLYGETMRPGFLIVNTTRRPALLRYNTLTGKLEMQEKGRIQTPLPAPAEVLLYISNTDSVRLRRDFAPVAGVRAGAYYHVLFNGKRKLLRYVRSEIKTVNEPMSSNNGRQRIEHRERHYVCQPDGQMVPVMASRKALLSLFPTETTRVETFLNERALNVRTWPGFTDALRLLE